MFNNNINLNVLDMSNKRRKVVSDMLRNYELESKFRFIIFIYIQGVFEPEHRKSDCIDDFDRQTGYI